MAASHGKTEGQVCLVLQVGGLQQSQFGAEELEHFFGKPRSSVYVGSPIKLGSDISKERP